MIKAIKILTTLLVIELFAFATLVATSNATRVTEAKPVLTHVNDCALIENIDTLREARITGYSVFKFDGVQYVIENLPEEYLKYSEWKCRTP